MEKKSLPTHENADLFCGVVKLQPGDISIVAKTGTFLLWYDISPKNAHDIHTARQAIYLVSEHLGVAIFAEPTTLGTNGNGVVVKPLADKSLQFQTCVVMGKDDGSRLTNEFARAFLRRYAPQRVPPKQMDLPLSQAHGSSGMSARNA